MSFLEALILGIIQGLTEFLPVSSSGHLELGKALFGLNLEADDSLTFDVVVHAGTALSTIVIFRKDILNIFRGLLQFKWNDETRFSLLIILSMIPAAFVGVVFDKQIEQLFDGQVLLVGAMLMITALLLFLADRARKTEKAVSTVEAIVIGIAQAIAILPGISRSGATISTSVLLGIDREKAARFSFLMVLPLILGKSALDAKEAIETSGSGLDLSATILFVGFAAAFVAGLFACQWMIALVKKAQLKYFAYYCFAVGAAATIYTLV